MLAHLVCQGLCGLAVVDKDETLITALYSIDYNGVYFIMKFEIHQITFWYTYRLNEQDTLIESKRLHKEVSMTYRLLLTELSLKPPIDGALKYMPALASKLNIPRPTERRAVEILQADGMRKELMGKDPRGVAAAALYLASELNGERVVQRAVAEAAETTEVTLRNRYRGLKKTLSIE